MISKTVLLIAVILVTSSLLNHAFAQQFPAVDTSIIDKSTELMDKSEKVLEKTGEVVEKTGELATKAEGVTEQLGGGCLIATATYGTELSLQVQLLREIRDGMLLQTSTGTAFMTGFNQFYYSFSPTIADLERQNPVFKEMVKATITPLLSSLVLLQYFDIDTEEEMLGYGISIILLNIGMYFVAPAFTILRLKSRLS